MVKQENNKFNLKSLTYSQDRDDEIYAEVQKMLTKIRYNSKTFCIEFKSINNNTYDNKGNSAATMGFYLL